MRNLFVTLAFLIFAQVIFNSCETELSPETKISLYQVGGCQSNAGSSLQKNYSDSCFSYSFFDKLSIDFCVTGNCCPEKNRFLITSTVVNDSIFIAVADTADELCDCICNYIIHGEFESLPLDKYFVKCFSNDEVPQHILYTEIVKR